MYGNYGRNVKAYQKSEIETADRGKLLLLVYDHCIKWCHKASEAMVSGDIEQRTKAIFKVQDGITELICALDFEKGGEIAKNLHGLYDFYNRHLAEANLKNLEKNVEQVREMLESLRGAWVDAIQKVRVEESSSNRLANRHSSYVSLLG